MISSKTALAAQRSFLDEITVVMLAHNEEENIERALVGVEWAKRIVVVDSGSTDRTAGIVRRFPRAEIVVRHFDNHQNQWNFGLDVCGESSKWILALDADYIVDGAFRNELAKLTPPPELSGYCASFCYCINGRPLRGNLYPPVTVLYRRAGARYIQDGHTQRVMLPGSVQPLQAPLYHDDRKPLSRWFASQQKYARLEADHLLAMPTEKLSRVDRIRLMGWPAPPLVFAYTLIVKRCILDGWAGWLYVLQRTIAEAMIALEIVDTKLRSRRTQSDDGRSR